MEETSLSVTLTGQFHTYSDPGRDPRRHTITTVFTATADGVPRAGDDAEQAGVFLEESLPSPLVFDHADILADYFRSVEGNLSVKKADNVSPRRLTEPAEIFTFGSFRILTY